MDRTDIAVALAAALIRNYSGKGLNDPIVRRGLVNTAFSYADAILDFPPRGPTPVEPVDEPNAI